MKTETLRALRPWLVWLGVWVALIVIPPNMLSWLAKGPLWNGDLMDFQWRLTGMLVPVYLSVLFGFYGTTVSPEVSDFTRVALNIHIIQYGFSAITIVVVSLIISSLLRIFLKHRLPLVIALGFSLSLGLFQLFSLFMVYQFGTAGP